MKRFALVLCGSAILLFSCDDNKNNTAKTSDKDSSSNATSTASTDQSAPMDSAAMMQAWMNYMTPGTPHQIIGKWDGTWTEDVTMWMEPGAPPEKMTGTAVNTMILGGRYQESKLTGTYNGQPFNGMSLLGYDNAKKMYQSTWLDNMGTGLIYMEGTMDTTTHILTMKGKGVDPTTGKELDMRQTFQLTDDNTQKIEMYCNKNGKEFKSMEIALHRK